ncbi:MAG: hypothetical protein QM820_39290 [Minicystis sp.]
MSKVRRSLFRGEITQRYAQRLEREVLPRPVRPRTFALLWLVLGLLLALAAITLRLARLPLPIRGHVADMGSSSARAG